MKFYKWLFIFLSLFAYSCETIPSNKVSATTQAIFLMHRYHVSNPRIKDLTKDIVANIEQLITDNKYELDKRPVSFDNLDTEDHYLALLGRIHNHYANNEGEGGRNMLHEALDMSLKNLDANSVLWRIGNITGPAKYGNIIDVKHEVIDGNIVYLDVSIINRQTAGKVQSVIEKMRSENIHIESIVLDLRSNPGGMLKGSVEIADIFLDAGIITSLRNGTDDIQHDASTNKLQSDYPMVVLVDQYTAAGAEVIATALKDNKRALVMGNSTGKQGTMQSTMPL
ncbi:hypothetical protein H8E50_02915, partial [bacterium]|nr:hypothetical protein [bacterium]